MARPLTATPTVNGTVSLPHLLGKNESGNLALSAYRVTFVRPVGAFARGGRVDRSGSRYEASNTLSQAVPLGEPEHHVCHTSPANCIGTKAPIAA